MSMTFSDVVIRGIRSPSSLSSIPTLDHLFLPTPHRNALSSLAFLRIPLLDMVVLLLVRSNGTDDTD